MYYCECLSVQNVFMHSWTALFRRITRQNLRPVRRLWLWSSERAVGWIPSCFLSIIPAVEGVPRTPIRGRNPEARWSRILSTTPGTGTSRRIEVTSFDNANVLCARSARREMRRRDRDISFEEEGDRSALTNDSRALTRRRPVDVDPGAVARGFHPLPRRTPRRPGAL